MSRESEKDWLHVAVAVVRNVHDQFLIAKRPDHLHQGGLWEFPGGKVEEGESIQQALVREIAEEIGIRLYPQRPLIEIRHDYGDKKVRLDVWLCDCEGRQAHQSTKPLRGKEGQWVSWVARQNLDSYAFPEANKAILQALSLPPSYLISPKVGERASFLESIDKALDLGIKLIQLRDSHLSEAEYIELAGMVGRKCQAVDARLLIKGLQRFSEIGSAAGIHLTSTELRHCKEADLKHFAEKTLIAASCHNLEEIHLAEQLGVDFVTLSPVLKTISHPEASPLGWQYFQHCCQQATVPVYALGGLKHEHIQTAWSAGAQGIAAIGGLWPK